MIHPRPEPARQLSPLIPGLPNDLARWGREVGQIVIVMVALYLVVNTFLTQPFEVELRSMEPTLQAGDRILVDKLTPRWDDYDRGDVVVFDAPEPYDADGVPYVKRVVAVAGDIIELVNGRVYLTPPGGVPARLDEPYLATGELTLVKAATTDRWTVPPGAVFVLGDNRAESIDSRTFGPIDLERVAGRAWVRYLPLDRLGWLGTDPELSYAPLSAPVADW